MNKLLAKWPPHTCVYWRAHILAYRRQWGTRTLSTLTGNVTVTVTVTGTHKLCMIFAKRRSAAFANFCFFLLLFIAWILSEWNASPFMRACVCVCDWERLKLQVNRTLHTYWGSQSAGTICDIAYWCPPKHSFSFSNLNSYLLIFWLRNRCSNCFLWITRALNPMDGCGIVRSTIYPLEKWREGFGN